MMLLKECYFYPWTLGHFRKSTWVHSSVFWFWKDLFWSVYSAVIRHSLADLHPVPCHDYLPLHIPAVPQAALQCAAELQLQIITDNNTSNIDISPSHLVHCFISQIMNYRVITVQKNSDDKFTTVTRQHKYSNISTLHRYGRGRDLSNFLCTLLIGYIVRQSEKDGRKQKAGRCFQ